MRSAASLTSRIVFLHRGGRGRCDLPAAVAAVAAEFEINQRSRSDARQAADLGRTRGRYAGKVVLTCRTACGALGPTGATADIYNADGQLLFSSHRDAETACFG